MDESIQRTLARLATRLNRREAAAWAVASLGAGLLAVWAGAVCDWFLQCDQAGRLVLWSLAAAVAVAGAIRTLRALVRRRSAVSMAAWVEERFPELDNHLINRVQFETERNTSAVVAAYLGTPIPNWTQLDLGKLLERRGLRRALAVLGVAVALLLLPWLWLGPAWSVAVQRVLNPFAELRVPSLAVLLNVSPGDAVVTQGDPLAITCRASGRAGQRILLELRPSDGEATLRQIGTLAGGGAEEFSWRAPKVSEPFVYRVRAGDARASPKYTVTVRPPLAFQSLKAKVLPPAYTGLSPFATDALAARLRIPELAWVEFDVTANRPLAKGGISEDSGPEHALMPVRNGEALHGSISIETARLLRVTATDQDGAEIAASVGVDMVPDKPPVVRVMAPVERVILEPGGAPRIEFEASDDYGLGKVRLERVARAGAESAPVAVLREWTPANRVLSAIWTGESADVEPGTAFRLVVTDNAGSGEPCPSVSVGPPLAARRPQGGIARAQALQDQGPSVSPHVSVSPLILFDLKTGAGLVEELKKSAEAAAVLSKIIALQRTNLEETRRLDAVAATADTPPWRMAQTNQTTVRRMTDTLLSDASRPLGTATTTLRRTYEGPMADVIETLDRVARLAAADRRTLSGRAIEQETDILRVLERIESGLAEIGQSRTAGALLGLIEALVKGQNEVLDITRAGIEKAIPVPAQVIRRQDGLASDLAEFIRACRDETLRHSGPDVEFAEVAKQAADKAEAKAIRKDMLNASEQLETGQLAAAAPFETRALASLKEVRDLLDKWRAGTSLKKIEDMKNTVQEARRTLDKIVNVESNVTASLRALEAQKDRSSPSDMADLAGENAEIKANMQEALAKLANDLHVLPELPVANEVVEDISKIYEEMKQVAGSDASPATELGLQKEDWILDALEKAGKRMDDMEMWLVAKPDNVQRNTETFDQQELPKIASTELPDHLEDIIGDLLEQQEAIERESDDSVGNQGTADLPAGWGIAEGEFTDYSAKGKSGNERPEHKDQDGRSLVGREGMSDGEVVAGSGKINEGDKNIEHRMTRDSSQAGQVKEEGHSEAVATGGGKLSGFAEKLGLSGQGPRRDADSKRPSELGRQAMLRQEADALYATASLRHIRTGSLDDAAYRMRQAEDALAAGKPMREVKELQRKAVGALKRTEAELGGEIAETSLGRGDDQGDTVEDRLAPAADEAPPRYRELVSDYFKALSEGE